MNLFIRSGSAFVFCLLSGSVIAHGVARSPEHSARSIDFPDVPGYQTLVVDLHTHSVFSDGHVWPKIRVEEALRDGLDGLAITEHLEYQPHRADIPHPDRNRAIVDAESASMGTNLLIIPGSEITRDDPAGHMNAVFISDANALINDDNAPADPTNVAGYYAAAKEWPAQNAVEAANAQGAFVFWNHPYWTRLSPDGIARMNEFHRANIEAEKLHGIEIANGQNYSEEAHAIAVEYDLTFIGVSDVHDLIDWDHPPSEGEHRPVNLVFAKERSLDAIKSALFEQRTVVWFRNLLIGREDVLMPLIDASISVVSASYRLGTSVLDVVVRNASDANFQLQNTSDLTFMDSGDLVTLDAHSDTRLSIKPGARTERTAVTFKVVNALTNPKENPTIELVFDTPLAANE